MQEQRRNPDHARRAPFAELARAAIERAVGETRGAEAYWSLGVNVAWVRFPEDGRWSFLGLHRHLDWLSGEFGIAASACRLDELDLLPGEMRETALGCRIRLGDLLEGEDRWWRAGADEAALAERLEWMAIQLRVKGRAWFSHRLVRAK